MRFASQLEFRFLFAEVTVQSYVNSVAVFPGDEHGNENLSRGKGFLHSACYGHYYGFYDVFCHDECLQ